LQTQDSYLFLGLCHIRPPYSRHRSFESSISSLGEHYKTLYHYVKQLSLSLSRISTSSQFFLSLWDKHHQFPPINLTAITCPSQRCLVHGKKSCRRSAAKHNSILQSSISYLIEEVVEQPGPAQSPFPVKIYPRGTGTTGNMLTTPKRTPQK